VLLQLLQDAGDLGQGGKAAVLADPGLVQAVGSHVLQRPDQPGTRVLGEKRLDHEGAQA